MANIKDNPKNVSKIGLQPYSGPTDFDTLLSQARQLVEASLVPFKDPADLVIVLQAASELNISRSIAMMHLHPIEVKSGIKRLTMSAALMGSLLFRGATVVTLINDCEPVKHFLTRGEMRVILTHKQLIEYLDNGYYLTSFEEIEKNGLTDQKPLIKVKPIYIDDGRDDAVTTLRFRRRLYLDIKTDYFIDIDETVNYYLDEAYQAGSMGIAAKFPKDTYYNFTKSMMYARCLSRGSKMYGGDLINNMSETTEIEGISENVEEAIETTDIPHTIVD